MVRRLDEIRLESWRLMNDHEDAVELKGRFVRSDAVYAAAFREHGIDPLGSDVAEAGRQVAASAISASLLAALDDWAGKAAREYQHLRPNDERLLAVARAADPNPLRDQVRQPGLGSDPVALRELAAAVDPAELTPAAILRVVDLLRDLSYGGNCSADVSRSYDSSVGVEERHPCRSAAYNLLIRGLDAHPDDFWLLLEAGSLSNGGETVGYLRAALALWPTTVAAWRDIGRSRSIELDVSVDMDEHFLAAEAEAAYRRAIQLDPTDWPFHELFGDFLVQQGRSREAEAAFREVIRLKPESDDAWFELGNLLEDLERFNEAIAAYREAVRLYPQHWVGHYRLGRLLALEGRYDEAVRAIRDGVSNRQEDADLRHLLGWVYMQADRPSDAEAAYREAIRLDPEEGERHADLGRMLTRVGRIEDAVSTYREVIRLDPEEGEHHADLGWVLNRAGKVEEAVSAYREATRLAPRDNSSWYGLGLILERTGRLNEAEAAYREAATSSADDTDAHHALARLLVADRRLPEAYRVYRRAFKIDPEDALALCNAAEILANETDRYAEAAKMMAKGHELGSSQEDWSYPSTEHLVVIERFAERVPRWNAALAGVAEPPAGTDALHMAEHAVLHRDRPLAAAELFKREFAAGPGTDDDHTAFLYNAACAAALSAGGRHDAAGLDAAERRRWRERALTWLRADLEDWRRVIDANRDADGVLPPPAAAQVREQLRWWLADPDLAPVRGSSVNGFPPAERAAWETLWADHAAALRANMAVTAPKPAVPEEPMSAGPFDWPLGCSTRTSAAPDLEWLDEHVVGRTYAARKPAWTYDADGSGAAVRLVDSAFWPRSFAATPGSAAPVSSAGPRRRSWTGSPRWRRASASPPPSPAPTLEAIRRGLEQA